MHIFGYWLMTRPCSILSTGNGKVWRPNKHTDGWWVKMQGKKAYSLKDLLLQCLSHIFHEIWCSKLSQTRSFTVKLLSPFFFFLSIFNNLEGGVCFVVVVVFIFVLLISALILESTNYWKQFSRAKISISPYSSFCLNSTTSLIPPGNNSLPNRATFSFKIDLKTRKQKSAFLFLVF